jgi:hypothetical protein
MSLCSFPSLGWTIPAIPTFSLALPALPIYIPAFSLGFCPLDG